METSSLEIKAENIRRRNRLENDILKHFFEGLFFFFPLLGPVYACIKFSKLRTCIYEARMDLRTIIHDLGGYEHLFQLRQLKGYYGSYAHIKELLDARFLLERKLDDYKKLNISNSDLESIKLLRTYGTLDIVSAKVSEFEKMHRELNSLKNRNLDLSKENSKLLADFAGLKREMKILEERLQSIFIDIGGAESIPQIKNLRNDYGSFKSIKEKLETTPSSSQLKLPAPVVSRSMTVEEARRMERLRTEFMQVRVRDINSERISEKFLKTLEKYKREVSAAKKELKRAQEELNALYVDVGGKEFIPDIKSLKNDYGSFRSIREQIERLSRLRLPAAAMAPLSSEDIRKIDRLKTELSQIKIPDTGSNKYNEKLSKELEDYKKEVASVKKELQKSHEELNKIYVDVGGKEFIPKIKKLKDNYGSFAHINEMLENHTPADKNADVKFAQKLKKYGSAESIIEKMSDLEKHKKEIKNLHAEKENWNKNNQKLLDEISRLKKEIEDRDSRLQKVFIDIDGKNLMKK